MWFSFAVGSREAVNVSLIFQMLAWEFLTVCGCAGVSRSQIWITGLSWVFSTKFGGLFKIQ